jgi:tripartite-type tricarboxylate transporter receptor subunit TctC
MSRDTERKWANRRTFIKTTGAASLFALAGCSGDGGDGGDGGSDGGDGGSDGGDGGSDGGDGGSDGGDGGDTEEPTETAIDYPSERLRFIVPYGPGGGFDTLTRITANSMEEFIDVGQVVENIEGSNGAVALGELWTADADGHTIGTVDGFMFNQQVNQDVPYELQEMTYYAQASRNFESLVVRPDTGIETWDDFVSEFAAGNILLGAPSPAASGNIQMYVLGDETGAFDPEAVAENTVVYGGAGEIYTALARGDIQAFINDHTGHDEYRESGDARLIASMIADDEPPSDAPDAATLPDMGVSGDTAQFIEGIGASYRGFAGPPDVPEERVEILRDIFDETLNSDAFQQRADESDLSLAIGSGADMAQRMQASYEASTETTEIVEALREAAGN